MKRIIAALMCAVLVLGLTACGAGKDETGPVELTPVPADFFDTPVPDAAAAETPAPEAPEPEETPAEPAYDQAAYQAARDCIGRTAEELFAAIGEPVGDRQYAASCLVEGGEDGMLYYDGFYVWTVKTDSEEIVHDVYLMD